MCGIRRETSGLSVCTKFAGLREKMRQRPYDLWRKKGTLGPCGRRGSSTSQQPGGTPPPSVERMRIETEEKGRRRHRFHEMDLCPKETPEKGTKKPTSEEASSQSSPCNSLSSVDRVGPSGLLLPPNRRSLRVQYTEAVSTFRETRQFTENQSPESRVTHSE